MSVDFSQGDEVFGENAGKQCAGMFLTAIIYHHLEHKFMEVFNIKWNFDHWKYFVHFH